MRIGICDDNASDAQKIAFALADITPGLEISCYETGGALLETAKNGDAFDLVFLDIYLKSENGMEIAGKLRQISPHTEIVFSTSSRDFAVDAFRVQAADYLVKPYTEADIVKAFARANVRRGAHKNEGIILNAGRQIRVFRPEEIIKIESDRHYTLLTAENGEETRIHLGYSEVISKFPKSFIELRRGIAVNMSFIVEINSDTVTLSNGETHSVARARLDQVVAAYTRFISETY